LIELFIVDKHISFSSLYFFYFRAKPALVL
jgi:hypothetical protein